MGFSHRRLADLEYLAVSLIPFQHQREGISVQRSLNYVPFSSEDSA